MRFSGVQKIIIIAAIIVVFLGLAALSIWGIQVKGTHFLKGFLSQILRPFQKLVTNVHHSVNDYWVLLTNLKKIKQENDRLTYQIDDLEFQLADYQKLKLENARIRKLLAFQELVPYQMVGAQVIGVTPNNWVQDLIIDRGSKDGLKPKMPVITYNGALVGQIVETTANTAKVTLITEVGFAVSGRIQRNDSRTVGVIRGQAGNQNTLIMDQIPWDAPIAENDLVVTSGLSDNYPKEIPIGRVTRIMDEDFGLIQKAEMKPFLSLEPIEEVLVITDF